MKKDERNGERERVSHLLVKPPNDSNGKTTPVLRQDLGLQPDIPHARQSPKPLSHRFLPWRMPWQKAELEVKQPGLKAAR